jgi:hypothetical protein
VPVTREQIVAALTQDISDVPEHARRGRNGALMYGPTGPWLAACEGDPVSDWRHPTERRDLVERLVKAEKRARIAEGQARVLMAEVPKDEIRSTVDRTVSGGSIAGAAAPWTCPPSERCAYSTPRAAYIRKHSETVLTE